MGFVVGCDLAGGFLKIYDVNETTDQLITVPKLRNQDIERIDDFFSAVRNKIFKRIYHFIVILDGTYKNDFRKRFIEIGWKHRISSINFIGFHQGLLLKAIYDLSMPVNNNEVLWIISLWKNQIYCTVWKFMEKDGWKFIENKKEQKGLGNHSTIKAISVLKTKIEMRKKPNFVKIYNKNLKPATIETNNKINFYENILDDEQQPIDNLFHESTSVQFQKNFDWCNLAFKYAEAIYNDELKFEHEFIFEKNTEIKLGKRMILQITKWQVLPFTKTLFLESAENDTIEIFEDDAYAYDIHLKKSKAVNLNVAIDKNGVYDITIDYDKNASKASEIEPPSVSHENSDASYEPVKELPNHTLQQNIVIPLKTSEYDNKLNAVGIDLGTTECCAAVIRKNGPDFVVLDQTSNNRTMPSFVAFDEEKPKCGKIVVDRMRHKFEYTVYDSKRIIGKSYERLAIDPLWPFTVSNIEKNVIIEIKTYDGVAKMKSEEISAALLKHIKLMVEEYQGTILTEAVITIPSEFSDRQKTATKIAAEMAGWEKIHFIPEPVAAAFAYFAEIDIPDNSNILICDCGGGTIDICVAKISNKQLDCLSFDGDAYLGGRDFDKVLYNHFNAILKHKYEIDVKESNRKYILNQKCQDIKHNLSTASEDWLDIDNFLADSNNLIKVQRDEFEELSAPLLLRIKNVIYNAISKTLLECKQIDYVFQVGGGCRMPMIKQLLLEIFPQAKHECNLYPDWVVAHGAALYAYHLKTIVK